MEMISRADLDPQIASVLGNVGLGNYIVLEGEILLMGGLPQGSRQEIRKELQRRLSPHYTNIMVTTSRTPERTREVLGQINKTLHVGVLIRNTDTVSVVTAKLKSEQDSTGAPLTDLLL